LNIVNKTKMYKREFIWKRLVVWHNVHSNYCGYKIKLEVGQLEENEILTRKCFWSNKQKHCVLSSEEFILSNWDFWMAVWRRCGTSEWL
jgi:hypothetical protein